MGICSSQNKQPKNVQDIPVNKSSAQIQDINEFNSEKKRDSTKVPNIDYDNPTPGYNPSISRIKLGLHDQNLRIDNSSEISKKQFQSQRSQSSKQLKQSANEQNSMNQYLSKPSKFKRQASKASEIQIQLPQILLEGIGSPYNLAQRQQNKRVTMINDIISRDSPGIQFIQTPMSQQYTVVRNSIKKYDFHGGTQQVQNNITGIERIVRALPKSDINSPKIIDKLRNTQLSHPNLIKLIEIYENKDNYYIIEEEPTGGSLYSYIEKNQLTENQLAIIMEQIISLMQYFHSNELIHGRLTIHSFYFLDKSPKLKIVLTDYLNLFEKSEICQLVNCYLPPESKSNGKKVSKEGDIWACGIIGVQLFKIKKELDKACVDDKQINDQTIEKLILTQLGIQFFQEMLQPNPEQRGSANALVKSQWFQIQCSKDEIKKQKIQIDILKRANTLQQKLIAFIIKVIPQSSTERFFTVIKEELNEEDSQQFNKEQVQRIYQKFHKKQLAKQLTDQLFQELQPIDKVDVEFFLLIFIPLCEIVTDVNLKMIFQILDAKDEQILKPECFSKSLGMNIQTVKENMKEILNSQNKQNQYIQGFSQVDFRKFLYNIL